jgi:subtilase family serine protease
VSRPTWSTCCPTAKNDPRDKSRELNNLIQPTYREYHAPGSYPARLTPSPLGILPLDNGSSTALGYVPQQIQTAYGLSDIRFGSITGNGTGQMIAIVDAYDDPSFVNSSVNGAPNPAFSSSDLAQFDQQFGLSDPPSFTKYNENGQTTNLPGTDAAGAGNPAGDWEIEEALDIEWAHAIAPGASIDLVEASSTSNNDLFKAVATAASLPGVSVVSMS